MKEERITADEIMAEIDMDVQQMAQKIADAINHAQAGAIINESEEPVRDALAVLRQASYQKALSLLEKKQQAFSPSTDTPQDDMA
jgi:hypothetical protein